MTLDRPCKLFSIELVSISTSNSSLGEGLVSRWWTQHCFFLFENLITLPPQQLWHNSYCLSIYYCVLSDGRDYLFHYHSLSSKYRTGTPRPFNKYLLTELFWLGQKTSSPSTLRVDFIVKYFLWTPYLYISLLGGINRMQGLLIYFIVNSGKAISIAQCIII